MIMARQGTIVEIDDSRVLEVMKLLDMGSKENRKALERGFMRAGSILRTAARKGSERILHNNIRDRQRGIYARIDKRAKNRGELGLVVGINKVVYLKNEGGRKFGLNWIELGTKRAPDGRGKWRGLRVHGATPPHHFFAASIEGAINMASNSVSDAIVKQLVKISAKRKIVK